MVIELLLLASLLESYGSGRTLRSPIARRLCPFVLFVRRPSEKGRVAVSLVLEGMCQVEVFFLCGVLIHTVGQVVNIPFVLLHRISLLFLILLINRVEGVCPEGLGLCQLEGLVFDGDEPVTELVLDCTDLYTVASEVLNAWFHACLAELQVVRGHAIRERSGNGFRPASTGVRRDAVAEEGALFLQL